MIRKSLSVVILVCALFYLPGCHHGSADHGHPEHETDPAQHSGLQLKLDGGKKWQVDEHTRLTAARITKLVEGSAAINSVEDARALGRELDQELDVLVKGCTMTGAAHDQLHVFLMAFLPKAEELKEETEVKDLQLARDEIVSLLDAYEKHFE